MSSEGVDRVATRKNNPCDGFPASGKIRYFYSKFFPDAADGMHNRIKRQAKWNQWSTTNSFPAQNC